MKSPGSRFQFPRAFQAWAACGACFLLPAAAPAHDSPEHVVEQLTAEIRENGVTGERLWHRATHYRELGRLDEAETDLRAALELEPERIAPANDLARVQLHLGRFSNALQTLQRALERAPVDELRAPLLLTRAEIHNALGNPGAALADCEQAFARVAVPDPEWFLQRAQIQLRAGQPAAAAAGLKLGFDQTGSAVIEAEWIEALIDAGKPRDALARIEAPLADSRWRSSWLLRRARARLEIGDSLRARGDLHAAVTELGTRLETPRPDPSLLLDRGFARALLGDMETARRDLDAARAAGAQSADAWRLEAVLSNRR